MNLLTIQLMQDDTYARNFLNYPNKDDALSALYYTMSASIADANVRKATCLLIDDNGATHKREDFERPYNPPVAEDEEQTEEE